MSTLSELRHFIRRHDLLAKGARVVVGVSGGPDSLALLHALKQLAPDNDWHLHAAYLNHGLRPEADEEADFVIETASVWGLGCTVEREDVLAIAAQPGVSLEEAARQARYAFLGRVALRIEAGFVAVGHHADDQAETVIMHLLRGSGLAGLRGILPRTRLADIRLPALDADERLDFGEIQLIRPWLGTPRANILVYIEQHELKPRYDASNADMTFFRNRLRHEIMPALQAINPQITRTLGRTAGSLQGDYEALAANRQALWERVAVVDTTRIRFPLVEFRALPRGDQRALLRKALFWLRPAHRNISWEHTERVLDLLADDPDRSSGGPYPLIAGVEARLSYNWLVLAYSGFATFDQPRIERPTALPLPGQIELSSGWMLTSDRFSWAGSPPWLEATNPLVIWLPIDVLQPLTVRPRQPDDTMRPFGLGGSKAVADLMTDLKLPRGDRVTWPLLVDAEGDILWLAGRRAGEGCRISESNNQAWEIRLMPPEGIISITCGSLPDTS